VTDILDELARAAKETIAEGYYDAPPRASNKAPSLRAAVLSAPRAVLAEVKPASPTRGRLRDGHDAIVLAKSLAKAGARGLSILTEPKRFGGSLSTLAESADLGVPTLMKDFVLSEKQFLAAHSCGASAALLIVTLFNRGYAEKPLADTVARAHALGLEVLAEVVSASEFEQAQAAGADLLGINNRDLRTMEVDLERTGRVLSNVRKDRPVVGMSGVSSRADADALYGAGADAVLVGTGLMTAADPAAALGELL